MARTFFDYVPETGTTLWFDYDEDKGDAHITYEQDLTGLVDRNKEFANTGKTDHGIKDGFWFYASLPVVYQYELVKRGLNPFGTSDEMRECLKVVNREWPWLKVTYKTHE